MKKSDIQQYSPLVDWQFKENGLPWKILLVLLLATPLKVWAQPSSMPLERKAFQAYERYASKRENRVHTAVKPLILSRTLADSIKVNETDPWERRQYNSWIGRKFRNESLIQVDSGEFHLSISPLLNLRLGQSRERVQQESLNRFTNTRGFIINGEIGEQFYFASSFYENQAEFPDYISNFIDSTGVAPGMGRVKQFGDIGYDYAMASGHIGYTPSSHFDFQLGHGKHFFGYGYRSLFLSDNAFNYPFLRITTTLWEGRLQYTNLFNYMSSLDRVPGDQATLTERLFQRKAGSFHYLSWIVHDKVQLGLFEGVIWQRWDSTGTKPFDPLYLNPVIGANTLIHGMDDLNNALVGANIRITPISALTVYGQFALDEGDRNGFQAGLKAFPWNKNGKVYFQFEFNTIEAFTYAHRSPLQSFSHYGQPLAHPLGADFQELIAILNYRLKDFYIEGKYVYAKLARESVIGSNNVLAPFDGTAIPLNTKISDLQHQQVEMGYIINPSTNFQIYAGVTGRRQSLVTNVASTTWIYGGVRTELINLYRDF